jgi:hypothetical protein
LVRISWNTTRAWRLSIHLKNVTLGQNLFSHADGI